jgi:hypothetical protein
VMNRLKALYRGWGIACAGTQVYAPRYREEWLSKIEQAGVRRRAELLYPRLSLTCLFDGRKIRASDWPDHLAVPYVLPGGNRCTSCLAGLLRAVHPNSAGQME